MVAAIPAVSFFLAFLTVVRVRYFFVLALLVYFIFSDSFSHPAYQIDQAIFLISQLFLFIPQWLGLFVHHISEDRQVEGLVLDFPLCDLGFKLYFLLSMVPTSDAVVKSKHGGATLRAQGLRLLKRLFFVIDDGQPL